MFHTCGVTRQAVLQAAEFQNIIHSVGAPGRNENELRRGTNPLFGVLSLSLSAVHIPCVAQLPMVPGGNVYIIYIYIYLFMKLYTYVVYCSYFILCSYMCGVFGSIHCCIIRT